MKITTIVALHNELEFLPSWFDSASKYSDEIICGIHAATDGSLEFIKEKQNNSSIPITILEFPQDTIYKHGFSYMKNALLEKATGDWIVSLDADEEMEITKELLAKFANYMGISTQTMHLTTKKEHWSLENTGLVKKEAEWIPQRHWRIWKNNLGIRWKGIIHEEPRLHGSHISKYCPFSGIKMYHYGILHNPAKREFKEGLYAELLLRLVEKPELREGTSKWWWEDYYQKNKEKLTKDREEYRKKYA